MKTLRASTAALALTAALANAQEGYSAKAASDMAKGYTSEAIDEVPGNGVGASGEQPRAESGATADMGGSVETDTMTGGDFGVEPEADAQAGVEVPYTDGDVITPLTDPKEEPVERDMASGADDGEMQTSEDSVEGGLRGVMGAETPSTEQFDTAQAETVTRSGFEPVSMSDISADDLTGAPVLDANNEDIGFVSELVVNMSGELTEAELALGGFLWGIGSTDILVSMSNLSIERETRSGDIQVQVDMTEDALMERAAQG